MYFLKIQSIKSLAMHEVPRGFLISFPQCIHRIQFSGYLCSLSVGEGMESSQNPRMVEIGKDPWGVIFSNPLHGIENIFLLLYAMLFRG